MRLLRLISNKDTDTITDFTSVYNQPIMIKENSKISLKNVSMSIKDDLYIVDDTNNELSFRLSANDPIRTVVLNTGEYNEIDLIDEILDKMNRQIAYYNVGGNNTYSRAFYWYPSVDSDSKILTFFYDQSSIIDFNGSNNDFITENMNTDAGVITSSTAEDNTFNSYIIDKLPFISMFEVTVDLSSNPTADSKGIVGLAYNKISVPQDNFNEAYYYIGVKFYWEVGNNQWGFSIIEDGQINKFVDASLDSGDIIRIVVDRGNFSIIVQSGSNYYYLYEESDYFSLLEFNNDKFPSNNDYFKQSINFRNQYYASVSCQGGDQVAFQNLKFYHIPNSTMNNDESLTYIDFSKYINTPASTIIHHVNDGLEALSNRNIILSFKTNSLQNMLGFNQLSYVKTSKNAFIGEGPIQGQNVLSGSVEIEIPSLQHIESYDAYTGARRPLIALIEAFQFTKFNNVYSYNETNLIFFNLNNKTPLYLYDIRARITQNGVPLDTTGDVSITLVFQD